MGANANISYLGKDQTAKQVRKIKALIQYVLAIIVMLVVMCPLY